MCKYRDDDDNSNEDKKKMQWLSIIRTHMAGILRYQWLEVRGANANARLKMRVLRDWRHSGAGGGSWFDQLAKSHKCLKKVIQDVIAFIEKKTQFSSEEEIARIEGIHFQAWGTWTNIVQTTRMSELFMNRQRLELIQNMSDDMKVGMIMEAEAQTLGARIFVDSLLKIFTNEEKLVEPLKSLNARFKQEESLWDPNTFTDIV